ncbi:MAG: aminopeptidase P family protein [Gammaproteobacteria bacterium]|nr:aminopeptidase P family protein [Gammaproteobacteria bacterium]
MKRRDLLKTTLAGGALLPLSADSTAAKIPETASLKNHQKGAEILRGGPLINLERAYKIMAEENLDGLIVTRPINFYYFTGYHDHLAVRHDAPSSFALITRDEKQPISIIMNQFIYYFCVADSNFKWPSDVYLFTGWDKKIKDTSLDNKILNTEPKANPPFVFQDKKQVPQGYIEKNRLDKLHIALENIPESADARWALTKAIRNNGLEKSKIGIDHPVIKKVINASGLNIKTIDGDHAIRKIKLIKTPREIELMRITAENNATAALNAVRAVRAGANHFELKALFFNECAKLGNMPLLMQIDSVNSEVFNTELKDGDAFAIDGVSQAFHYTGDYGRTIFLGEPSRSMKDATDAIAIGWDAVREKLKPGLRYSEIRAIGRDAIKKSGYNFNVAVTPHSVGLSHTDEPGKDGPGSYWVKDDLVLEENMIISVDMPVLHTGIGGSAHLEDLTLITKDGGEQINDIGDRIVII